MDWIAKRLSSNDVGLTGTHQAGILVPKEPRVLNFFPALSASEKNPRAIVNFKESETGADWEFHFIYYNNRFFGGTRNEYRLTHTTKFIRSTNAKDGDELVFTKGSKGRYEIGVKRANRISEPADAGVLLLSGGWKVIKY